VSRIQDGLTTAADVIDNGKAAAVLEDLRRLSTSSEATPA